MDAPGENRRIDASLKNEEDQKPTGGGQDALPEEVTFILLYDEEIHCLVNEGALCPGRVPSGF
ncbi:MAG TPA: hypothetical protein VMT52_18440, partial [Planctomycetota bacterium]|nr:hypothetical protein [Planctomycetota bacterium]